MRKLQALVEQRRQMVDERTAQTNRITQQLKLYFPQVLEWFDDLTAPIVAAFLRRWPTLADLQKEAPETIRAFFHEHGSRSSARINQRLQQIQQAKAPVSDEAVIEPGVLAVETALASGIERRHSECGEGHRGSVEVPTRIRYFFFLSRRRTGDGAASDGRFWLAPGALRQRWVHFRWACPKFLRQTFHAYAALSLQHCAWAKAFYDQQKAKGKGHHAAVRSLAHKWIRIVFRCWQSRQPYYEDLFLAARQGRALPLTRKPDLTGPAQTARNRGKTQDRGFKK